MALTPGTRLGQFEVTAQIGVGGMGEVYQATDTKLKRQVAIKVLPVSVAADAERLARFQREAEVLASLNHPNIAAIYGLEDADGVKALVMELVEGDDLSERIARAPIAIDEALSIAKQIADALEAAHEQSIVHRDLKPANIKVRSDGTVKVLDFGLAKAMDDRLAMDDRGVRLQPDLTHSPTITSPAHLREGYGGQAMTQAGTILGTAAYMSPEQAKGRAVDKRSDVWAFGAVLYEMLTGRRAFEGEDVSDTLARILMKEPDWTALPATVPPAVVTVLRRCLQKDRKQRLRDIGDVSLALEGAFETTVSGTAASALTARPRPLWRRAVPVVAVVVVTAIVASVAAWALKPSSSVAGAVTRFSMVLPDDSRFGAAAGPIVAISPDGTRIVHVGDGQLFLRSMADLDARPISATGTLGMPFFSPDGQWIGFYSVSDATLKKIAVSGGAPLTLFKFAASPTPGHVQGPSWDGDQILFAQEGKGIMRVSAHGGEAEVLVPLDSSQMAYGPQLLPGGHAVLFSLATEPGEARWDTAQIVVQSLTSSARKVLVRGGSAARYVPTGHLVYTLGGTLLAIPFDVVTLEVRGGPVPILEGVRRASTPAISGAAQFAFSTSGSLVYVPGSAVTTTPQTLALVDRAGKVQPLGLPPQPYYHPRISPDGKQMVFGTHDGKDSIVWVSDLKVGATARRLTFGGRNLFPIWTPDGRFITFTSDRDGDQGLFRQPADGSGTAERLTRPGNGMAHRPEAWHPEGKTLSLLVPTGSAGADIWTLSAGGEPKPLVALPTHERYSVFSPDGRWLAYQSNEAGGLISDVYVQPFPTTGAKYQVSTGGGTNPVWSPDGRQLFYNTYTAEPPGGIPAATIEPGKLVAVDVRTQPAFSVGTPVPISTGGAALRGTGTNYDITPDGKQFLVVIPAGSGSAGTDRPTPEQINVVLNWQEELKQRVPTR